MKDGLQGVQWVTAALAEPLFAESVPIGRKQEIAADPHGSYFLGIELALKVESAELRSDPVPIGDPEVDAQQGMNSYRQALVASGHIVVSGSSSDIGLNATQRIGVLERQAKELNCLVGAAIEALLGEQDFPFRSQIGAGPLSPDAGGNCAPAMLIAER